MLDVEIGGPRLISVGRGTKAVEQPPDAVTRAAADLYLYQKDGQMGPEPWLVFAWDPAKKEAGNTRPDIERHEQQPYHLEYVGQVPMGILFSCNRKLSMICADMSKKFMDQATIPHDLLLPKRVPASLRMSEYWQLWVSL